MDWFFTKDYVGTAFQFLGPAHLAALGVILLFNLYLIRFKGASESARRLIRYSMAGVLWANEIGWHLWNYFTGQWTIQTMLPLHVCSLLVWTGALMLITKNYTIYEFTYFLGIGGALQALLTPDLGIYGFPHYRFFQTFLSHGLIVTSAIYMTAVEGYRPTWKSFLRVAVLANLYMMVVFGVNSLIGSNYMFINHKPATASLLDALPAWPWYILWMEAIGLVTFLLLYLPFIIKDWRTHSQARTRLDGIDT
jgi:hypothetical integral membrane protein (TIGR02206 family)